MIEYLENIINAVGDPIFVKDSQSRFTVVNDSLCKMLGKSRVELIGKTGNEFLPKEEMDHFLKMDKEVLSSGEESLTEEKLTTKNGIVRVIVTKKTRFVDSEGKKFLVGVIRDITESKEIQTELLLSEERFRLAMDATNDALWDWNMATNEVYRNSRHSTMLGYEMQEAGSDQKEWEERIHPEDKAMVAEITQEVLAGRKSQFTIEYRLRAKTGEYVWVLGRGKVVAYDKEGNPLRLIGTNVDITKSNKAEQVIRENEERFEQIASSLGEWIWELDVNGLYTYVSRNSEEILGYNSEEIVGKMYFYDFFVPQEKDKLKKEVFEAFSQKQPFRDFVNKAVHKNGTIVTLKTNGLPIVDSKGTLIGYRGADANISDYKKAEEAMNEKLRQLEIFNQASTDRELKMIDLKDRISELEKKLTEKG